MLARMRYVTERANRDGSSRWYWQRPGHKLTRLPDDPAARFAMQERLNGAADGRHPAADIRGSIAWMIATYRKSDRFKDLKLGTARYYDRYLDDIERLGPGLRFADVDRAMVVDFIHTYAKPHQRRQVAAVLKNLVSLARYHGLMETDPTTDLRLKTNKARDRVWSETEISAWLKAAVDPHMATAFLLLQYTAQRPGDVLAMTWAQYNGRA